MTGDLTERFEPARVEGFLRSRGAEQVPHAGGSLYDHLRRVAALLAEWGAAPAVRAAGLCHACYGTAGFDHPLLDTDDRATLTDLIGPSAEALVYLYGSCDRDAVYPRLAEPGSVAFRDRFTGVVHHPPEPDVLAFVEITVANELDVLAHDPVLAARHGAGLFALFASARARLSDAGWRAAVDRLGPRDVPAPDQVR